MRKLGAALSLGLLFVAVALALLLHKPAQAQSTARLVTVLSSASRTSDTTSLDQVNFGETSNVRGGYITLDVTGAMTTPLITLTLQAKDPVSGNYENLLVASTGVSTIGTHTYLVYPGIGNAAGDVVQVLSYPLPPTWRVLISHNDTDPITYSVGAMLVN